jgi:hypothetical protein
MSGRPIVRTASLTPESLDLFREVFGGSGNAFRALAPGISYSVFRRAWDGKAVTPEVVSLVEASWTAWAANLVRRVQSAA